MKKLLIITILIFLGICTNAQVLIGVSKEVIKTDKKYEWTDYGKLLIGRSDKVVLSYDINEQGISDSCHVASHDPVFMLGLIDYVRKYKISILAYKRDTMYYIVYNRENALTPKEYTDK